MNRKVLAGVLLSLSAHMTNAHSIPMSAKEFPRLVAPLDSFQVVELRRYTIKPGQRAFMTWMGAKANATFYDPAGARGIAAAII